MELVVHDEYFEEVGDFLSKHIKKQQEIIFDYYRIMENVCEEGLKQGKTADALNEFINEVYMETSEDNLDEDLLADTLYIYCKNFVTRIDENDEDLY